MPDLSHWFIRVFESHDDTNELLYYVQSDKGLAWGPFESEVAAWAWLREGDPDENFMESTARRRSTPYVQNKSPLNLAVKPAPSLAAPQNAGPSVAAAPVGNGLLQPQSLGSDLPVGYKRDGRSIVCHVVINQDGSSTDDPICRPLT